MSLFKYYLEMITTASLGNWSQNPNGIGFDMPLEAAKRINKERFLQGLSRKEYAKIIGTTENYYDRKTKKFFKKRKKRKFLL